MHLKAVTGLADSLDALRIPPQVCVGLVEGMAMNTMRLAGISGLEGVPPKKVLPVRHWFHVDRIDAGSVPT